jgi:hypothetical protein
MEGETNDDGAPSIQMDLSSASAFGPDYSHESAYTAEEEEVPSKLSVICLSRRAWLTINR